MAREGLNPEAAKWKHFAPARGREGRARENGKSYLWTSWVFGQVPQTVMPPSNREEEKERKAGPQSQIHIVPRGCAPCAHGILIAALLQPVRV